MPSPFPGMDPYIESSGEWGDFHTSLLTAIRGQLNATLPRRYRAKVDLFIFVQDYGSRSRRRLEPDVYVVERPRRPQAAGSATTLVAPATITLPAVRRKHRSVLIVDRKLNRIVTAIEILSPANKAAGDDRTAYLAKRNEYLGTKVSLVEIDLLRGGPRLPLDSPSRRTSDYYVLVCRSWEFPRADLWSFALRDPLPAVPVPLAEDVPDTILPLRACIDRAYDEGSYDADLDYDEPLIPRVPKGDAAWVRTILASRQVR